MRIPYTQIDINVNRLGYWWTVFGPGGVLAVAMSWLFSAVGPIAAYGWGAVVLLGIASACIVMLVASVSLVAWRYFNPIAETEREETVHDQGSYGLDKFMAARGVMQGQISDLEGQLRTAQEQIRNVSDSARIQIDRLNERIVAQKAVYALRQHKREIERLMLLLDRTMKQPKNEQNWELWRERFRRFESQVFHFVYIVRLFYPNEADAIRDVPAGYYRGSYGEFAPDNFPDQETGHDFKTFRKICENYRDLAPGFLQRIEVCHNLEIPYSFLAAICGPCTQGTY